MFLTMSVSMWERAIKEGFIGLVEFGGWEGSSMGVHGKSVPVVSILNPSVFSDYRFLGMDSTSV